MALCYKIYFNSSILHLIIWFFMVWPIRISNAFRIPEIGEYKSQVGLALTEISPRRSMVYCGGTLVTLLHVVVTPQCFLNTRFVCEIIGQKVYAGMNNYLDPDLKYLQIRHVSTVIRHPRSTDSDQILNALMVLTLNSSFIQTCAVRSAMMASVNPPMKTRCSLLFWRDLRQHMERPWAPIVLKKYVSECTGKYSKEKPGVLCFKNVVAGEQLTDIDLDDVYATVLCNFKFSGVLVRPKLKDLTVGSERVYEVTAESVAYHSDWINDVIGRKRFHQYREFNWTPWTKYFDCNYSCFIPNII
ncbi:uncharacterized protein LOC119652446 isoform X2 [Hermetia illucens]|uniref:uncharacterized protein LOC119652446 isoform X2 n=1 Tax=Hermetia illucens TaxID=343691 RepID=UPI0018CC4BCF|nr:uncharacterized protein LOC119652446 isoform X2 [Hermetia illucens]